METAYRKYPIVAKYQIPLKLNYRYGKPEGVVLHEAGNRNNRGLQAASHEITYMVDHYRSAFVHAWVDIESKSIIEIANTDYKCYGALEPANSRYVQIETPTYQGRDNLLLAFDMEAYWAAVQLWYYGLEATSALEDGKGTIWTHRAVSKFLSGDHTDPYALLQEAGLSEQQLVSQVIRYTKALKAKQDTRQVPSFYSPKKTPSKTTFHLDGEAFEIQKIN